MTVKELIKQLQAFDGEHHVVVKDRGKEREKDISNVRFDGRNCVVETEEDWIKIV